MLTRYFKFIFFQLTTFSTVYENGFYTDIGAWCISLPETILFSYFFVVARNTPAVAWRSFHELIIKSTELFMNSVHCFSFKTKVFIHISYENNLHWYFKTHFVCLYQYHHNIAYGFYPTIAFKWNVAVKLPVVVITTSDLNKNVQFYIVARNTYRILMIQCLS